MLFNPPVIKNLSDVLPYIKDNPAFIVKDKGWYTVIDYVYNSPDSFQNEYQRECRGLKFCSTTGRVLARPFHKFFNYGEREETREENIDFSQPHTILSKEDGSMVHTCLDNDGGFHLMTRMGKTEIAEKAQAFLASSPLSTKVLNATYAFTAHGQALFTLIFEYVGPKNRIVVYYDEEDLILTGVRTIRTGQYLNYAQLKAFANAYGLHYVKKAYVDFDREAIASDPYNEGVVVRFDTGAMVKVKADAYVRKHRFKDQCSSNKGLISLFVHNELDDVLPNLDSGLQKKIKEYINSELSVGIASQCQGLEWVVEQANEAGCDRKQFALGIRSYHPIVKALLFKVHSGDNPSEVVLEAFKKNCTSNTRLSALMAALHIKEWEGDFFESE